MSHQPSSELSRSSSSSTSVTTQQNLLVIINNQQPISLNTPQGMISYLVYQTILKYNSCHKIVMLSGKCQGGLKDSVKYLPEQSDRGKKLLPYLKGISNSAKFSTGHLSLLKIITQFIRCNCVAVPYLSKYGIKHQNLKLDNYVIKKRDRDQSEVRREQYKSVICSIKVIGFAYASLDYKGHLRMIPLQLRLARLLSIQQGDYCIHYKIPPPSQQSNLNMQSYIGDLIPENVDSWFFGTMLLQILLQNCESQNDIGKIIMNVHRESLKTTPPQFKIGQLLLEILNKTVDTKGWHSSLPKEFFSELVKLIGELLHANKFYRMGFQLFSLRFQNLLKDPRFEQQYKSNRLAQEKSQYVSRVKWNRDFRDFFTANTILLKVQNDTKKALNVNNDDYVKFIKKKQQKYNPQKFHIRYNSQCYLLEYLREKNKPISKFYHQYDGQMEKDDSNLSYEVSYQQNYNINHYKNLRRYTYSWLRKYQYISIAYKLPWTFVQKMNSLCEKKYQKIHKKRAFTNAHNGQRDNQDDKRVAEEKDFSNIVANQKLRQNLN